MPIIYKDINVDEMNLYDYILNTFSKYFDLTSKRFDYLNSLLMACYAKYINIAELRAVFDLENSEFLSLYYLIVDEAKSSKLREYGLMCYQSVEKEKSTIIEGAKLEIS